MSGEAYWLPIVFIFLMGLAVLIYAVLDGFDLGVGILMPMGRPESRDTMFASIGPFWDANETWLVLAVGLLLIAFPTAHSEILGTLYLPAFFLLFGLILRGVAFDFRAKAHADYQLRWDRCFKAGSLIASLSQGYMLGIYVTGFSGGALSYGFGILSAICVTAAYAFIGACWLVRKTEGDLQVWAARRARLTAVLMIVGLVSVSLLNPFISPEIFDKWFTLPQALLLLLIPFMCAVLFVVLFIYLRHFPYDNDFGSWVPFACAIGIFVLSFQALAYSYFPYVVPGKITIWEAASAPESLMFILVGALFVLPTILTYTFIVYRVFGGKTQALSYGE